MKHAAGFFGGSDTKAKRAANLCAGKAQLEGTRAEVITMDAYDGADPLEMVRGVKTHYVVLADNGDIPVRLEVC